MLAKYVVVSRGHPGCRNIDLCASATAARPLRGHREVGVARRPSGALRLAEMVEMAEACRGLLDRPPEIDLLEADHRPRPD